VCTLEQSPPSHAHAEGRASALPRPLPGRQALTHLRQLHAGRVRQIRLIAHRLLVQRRLGLHVVHDALQHLRARTIAGVSSQPGQTAT
jgi:hypothetical protein